MTEENWGKASEITGFAVRFWTSNFPKESLQLLPTELTCNFWSNGKLTEKGKVGVSWDFVVSSSERIVWRRTYPLCNRCMIPGHEWAEPTGQNNRLLPPPDTGPRPVRQMGRGQELPDWPEINCPMVLLFSEFGFYFTCTELVTNEGHKQLSNEISN